MFGLPRTNERPRNVRLDTLIRLRWLAVFGQFAAVLVVHFGLEFEVPIWPCLAVIALAALLNVALRVSFHQTQWLEPDRAAWLLGFDIAELAALLYLTGGLENPFAFLLLGPVLISATALPPRMTLLIGTFAMFCATVLVFLHFDLPWDAEDPLELPEIYMVGVWLSILLAIGYIGVYTWQIAEEARQLSDALAATELVLAREQHLSQLDGLAAAAAHELGTPLSTITVVVREIERALEANSPYADDVKLLREQAQRCREILAKITELPTGEPFDRMPLSALIEEAVAPHRNFGVSIGVTLPPDRAARTGRRAQSGDPLRARQPDRERRRFRPQPGRDLRAMDRATRSASPSATTGRALRPRSSTASARPMSPTAGRADAAPEDDEDIVFGLGLGFFIAKTLLERSGAKLSLINQAPPLHGATVTVTWSRADFERPLALRRLLSRPPGPLSC